MSAGCGGCRCCGGGLARLGMLPPSLGPPLCPSKAGSLTVTNGVVRLLASPPSDGRVSISMSLPSSPSLAQPASPHDPPPAQCAPPCSNAIICATGPTDRLNPLGPFIVDCEGTKNLVAAAQQQVRLIG